MNKIKEARHKLGLTQERLAALANLSVATIVRAERGLSITRNNADRLAAILCIDAKEFHVSTYLVRRNT